MLCRGATAGRFGGKKWRNICFTRIHFQQGNFKIAPQNCFELIGENLRIHCNNGTFPPSCSPPFLCCGPMLSLRYLHIALSPKWCDTLTPGTFMYTHTHCQTHLCDVPQLVSNISQGGSGAVPHTLRIFKGKRWPCKSLPSGAPGLHALLNVFGINFPFDYTYTYTFHCFGNQLQECNRSPLGLHLHTGDYTYTPKLFSN